MCSLGPIPDDFTTTRAVHASHQQLRFITFSEATAERVRNECGMPAYVCTGDGSAEENAEENETDEEALGGVHTRDRYPVLVMDTAEAVVHGDADSYSEEKTNPYPSATLNPIPHLLGILQFPTCAVHPVLSGARSHEKDRADSGGRCAALEPCL